MKAVILAGGFGTRFSEETTLRPKPMIEIGGKPILWHIMKIYDTYGINEFIIALGYKAEIIKEYFLNFYAINNNISIDLSSGKTTIHDGKQPNWNIHLVDTGLHTQTGGRLKRVQSWLDDNEPFLFTYGDGVSDVNMRELIDFHKSHKSMATVTAVQPPGRFGIMNLKKDQPQIQTFQEKPQGDGTWINGGFFVLEPGVLEYISDDTTVWEKEPMEKLARDGNLTAYRHGGFWQAMDSLRDKIVLEDLWNSDKAPWKVW
jgi:glucose-1-phosphate cytidylyltransferase